MHRLAAPLLGLGLILGSPALAEAPFPEQKAAQSPFQFAKSGAKAARDKAAAEADPAGAKVIGGQIAQDGAWPWQVALTVSDMPVSVDSQFCGGSLVLDQWVLTAAHCVHMPDENGVGYDLRPDEVSIVIGTNRLDGSGDRIPVSAIYRHPSYSVDGFDFDIALMKLARPPQVPYRTIGIPDAQFASMLQQPGITTIVTGWGIQNGGNTTAELRQAQIQMLDREMCNSTMMEARTEEAAGGFAYAAGLLSVGDDKAYEIWDELVANATKPLSENMICSGSFEGGRTSCNGDSGGPLVVPLEDGSFIQAGVVSWGLTAKSGKGCEEMAMFSAYTDVSKFLPWLNDTITGHP